MHKKINFITYDAFDKWILRGAVPVALGAGAVVFHAEAFGNGARPLDGWTLAASGLTGAGAAVGAFLGGVAGTVVQKVSGALCHEMVNAAEKAEVKQQAACEAKSEHVQTLDKDKWLDDMRKIATGACAVLALTGAVEGYKAMAENCSDWIDDGPEESRVMPVTPAPSLDGKSAFAKPRFG